VLAGTGCSGVSQAASDPPAQPPGVAVCHPAQLRAIFRGFQAAGGSLTGAVVVADAGTAPCLLDGSPRSISLLDHDGNAVAVKEHALDFPPNGGPVKLKPGAPLPAFGSPLAAGSAWLSLAWSNWCSDATPAVQSLLLVLPRGGSIAVPLDAGIPSWAEAPPTPVCSNSHSASTLTYGRFQPPAGAGG